MGVREGIPNGTVTKKFVLLDIDYITRNRVPVIRLFGKVLGEEEGHIIAWDKSFKPYIYVIPQDIKACTRDLSELGLQSVEKVYQKDQGKRKEVLNVTFKHPQDIPKLRDRIGNLNSVQEVREHDIPFYRRYLIDKGLSPLNAVEVEGKVLKHGSAKGSPTTPRPCILQVKSPPTVLPEAFLPEFSVLSFDIEVYNPRGMPQAELDPIIMISFSSNRGLQKVISYKNLPSASLLHPSPDSYLGPPEDFVEVVANEKELLEKFVETVQSENPDFIMGYNSDAFDLPYIMDRAAKLGVPLHLGIDGSTPRFTRMGFSNATMIRGRVHIDLYSYVRRYLHLERHTLERVYLELFGQEKYDLPGDEIHLYWDKGDQRLERLFHYSLDDAVAVTQIGEEMLPVSMELTRIVGQPLFDVSRMASGQQVEWYLIRKSFETGNLVPNRPSPEELTQREGKQVVGGYVKEPITGLHENIVYFDFRSLYPSIIISKNISPDTFTPDYKRGTCHVCPEYGHKFHKEPVGFIPAAMGKILKDRIRIKSRMKQSRDDKERQILNAQQEALKRLANTFYGLYNHSTFRWYSLQCSESITAWGRDFLKKTMKDAENNGFKPVYADTDGFFATYNGFKVEVN